LFVWNQHWFHVRNQRVKSSAFVRVKSALISSAKSACEIIKSACDSQEQNQRVENVMFVWTQHVREMFIQSVCKENKCQIDYSMQCVHERTSSCIHLDHFPVRISSLIEANCQSVQSAWYSPHLECSTMKNSDSSLCKYVCVHSVCVCVCACLCTCNFACVVCVCVFVCMGVCLFVLVCFWRYILKIVYVRNSHLGVVHARTSYLSVATCCFHRCFGYGRCDVLFPQMLWLRPLWRVVSFLAKQVEFRGNTELFSTRTFLSFNQWLGHWWLATESIFRFSVFFQVLQVLKEGFRCSLLMSSYEQPFRKWRETTRSGGMW
jgi:hypothetical protein